MKIRILPGLVILGLALLLSSCHLGRMVFWNYADFDDHEKFPQRTIATDTSNTGFRFTEKEKDTAGDYAPQKIKIDGQKHNFDSLLKANHTTAFLIIKNDTLFYEKYFDEHTQESLMSPFSITKSMVSALVGIAIEEGHIKSVNQKVTDFLPALNDNGFENVTIEHLLDMQSGLKFKENYYAPSGVAKFYYGRKLDQYIKNLETIRPPGDTFIYQSANTQLLGAILQKATGTSLSEFLESRLWKPMGMEYPAIWSLDRKGGQEKAFCCLNARARDFARFGSLYLNQGKWQGRQLVPQEWVKKSTTITRPDQAFNYYYHWWHCVLRRPVDEAYESSMTGLDKKITYARDRSGNRKKYVMSPLGDYFAEGHLGQYIYLSPEADLMILRFGKESGNFPWIPFFKSFSNQLKTD